MDITDDILLKFQSGELSVDEFKKEMALASKKQVQFKVTPKGCIGFYGVRNKFPISLYRQEVELILNSVVAPGWKYSVEFEGFLTKNDLALTTK
jgi:hypothetical protein